MILQTGFRTDIPGFYSTWFANRLRAGFVLVRNPYDPQSVTRYAINPDVVDLIGFCTKNPAPMLPRMELLRRTLAEDFSPACPRLLLEENPRRILEDRPLVGTDEPIFSPREDEL